MNEKYIVVQTWCSSDPIVTGTFKSYKLAEQWIKNYSWDNYDRNNELIMDISKLREVKT
tara:strand:+ start:2685 stop:2861 length:177 start_codon:yes stop_codon:yes gene_type:complete